MKSLQKVFDVREYDPAERGQSNYDGSGGRSAEGPFRNTEASGEYSVMNGSCRIMLRFHAPDSGFRPWNHFFFKDHWITAMGRLLIAMLDAAREICADCGIKPFPAAGITKIRKNVFVRFSLDEWTVIGHWIRIPGFADAAFGFGVPHVMADKAFACSAHAAEQIVYKINHKNQEDWT